jgi:MFS family permease
MVSVGGRLSDIFGRRYFYIAGPAISCIGAIVGATGNSIGQMIASGVIFGIGGGLGEMSLGLVQEIVPNRWRVTTLGTSSWQVIIGIQSHMSTLGLCDVCTTISAFGPLTAYAFIAYVPIKWRAVYWFCFAIEFFAMTMAFFFYKPPSFKTKHRQDGKSKMALLRQLDYLGLFLFASGLTLLLIGITWVSTFAMFSSQDVQEEGRVTVTSKSHVLTMIYYRVVGLIHGRAHMSLLPS